MMERIKLRVGKVLHLDPDTLYNAGAVVSCGEAVRTKGKQRFFILIEKIGNAGVWLPLFSNDNGLRFALPKQGRTGHPNWTKGITHYHPHQMWFAKDAAIDLAAAVGDNKADNQHPNYMTRRDLLPTVEDLLTYFDAPPRDFLLALLQAKQARRLEDLEWERKRQRVDAAQNRV